ncbi:MAG TPA: FAD-dependent oxidoreductase [Syntrophales bacterium]|jgi:NADPH-dependent 2,4-dienoyl-CoA reductase/sulfur reductase-like enzyme|nr:FAD-dependent oxidoreductase [Syntrophales bacterium]HOX95353.1 FAD-dependent oxidoreductase [Syntrophales bacterium]HPI56596.1 FAD-dependent oxidoreductase [Syntrophales bacterium]HPN24983.1 FAD-dependent oxidoreductase [Syntrophales bacterium]HQM29275.1 FAD-dependent oxidoreductase [Syntrophales bacterium]
MTPEEFRKERNIDARILHEVTEIDIKNRRVHVRDLRERKELWQPFDILMIATGALPAYPDVPGADAKGIYGVHTLQSGVEVRRVVDEEKPRRAVIVGGGYIGLEMAEAFIMRGMDVSLVERSEQVMGTLDPDMGALVSDALLKIGVKLYRNESLESFDAREGKVTAVVTDRRSVPADIVITGLGVRPNTALAGQAGIPLGVRDAIKVNDRMQTSIEGVWAGGDCAESFHLVSRRPVHFALGTIANKQGRVAGINIGGEYATFRGVVGTAVSKICSVEVARTGLQEREIRALGLQYVTGRIESMTRAHYYPNAGTVTVKVLAEKGCGRLLGGQIVGVEGAAKRIDVLATSLHAEFTVLDMIDLDLSYAPPYSPVWDPVIVAARKAADAL